MVLGRKSTACWLRYLRAKILSFYFYRAIFIQVGFFLICWDAFGFGPGDRVKVISSSVVRVGPGISYRGIFTNQPNQLGVIITAPVYDGNSFYWCSNRWDNGVWGYSATQNLNTIQPNVPILISPGSASSPGKIYTNSTLAWSWSASIGATNYGQYIRDTTTGVLIYSNDYIGNLTSFTGSLAQGLSPGHGYKWNMTASDSAGFSGVSDSLYFRFVPPPINILIGYNSVTATSAVFTASFYPNGTPANGWFQYGNTTAYGNTTGTFSISTSLNSQWTITATNAALLPGQTYHFQLVVINDGGAYYSGDAFFTTSLDALSAPSSLAISNATNGISLTWRDNSSNESGFRIKRRQGAITNYFSIGANQTNYTDTSVSSGSQYCYSIAATNANASSDFTSEQCATYTASGAAPIAIIAGSLNPVTGVCTYYGRYSTGTAPLQYLWSTSDNQHSSAKDPQFTFGSPGGRWIYLTVTDPLSRTSSASIWVNVQAANNGTQTFAISIGADPVVLQTGNYIQSHVDLRIPGKGVPFEFRRFYNSQFSGQTNWPLGIGWTFSYNERLQITGTNVLAIQSDGSTWTFSQSGGQYVAEPGIYDALVYNGDNTWTLTDKNQTARSFDASGRLVAIADKNGNTLACAYVGGVLSAVTNSAGRVVAFTANELGCITNMTDPIGRTVQFRYDSQTNLVAVVDANGHTNQYFYNENHQITNATDANGVSYVYNEYNPTNFTVIRQRDAYNNWTYFAYDFVNRITWQTNTLNKVSTHYFDDRLLETNVIDEAGNQQTFLYDSNRNRIYIKDKNGNETRYGYDSRGNVTNKIDALNNVTAITYDVLNNPTRRVDALANVTTFGYDSHGNLTSTTNALNLVSSVQYDASGLPTILTDARGNSTANQYDSQGSLTNAVDSSGFATSFAYDDAGRRIRQTDALNHTTSFTYDNNDNLIATTNALNFVNTYTYDGNNNRITSTDPRHATVTNVFDLKDRLIASIAPLNSTNGIVYDALDRKIAAFDALGNLTSYAYDDIGNVAAVTNALFQVTHFGHDSNGNQTSVTDPTGHSVASVFDPLNRKVAVIDASISTNLTAYDALGRVIATTNAIGQVTRFFYDGIGRLTNVIDAANQSVSFAYDENGNRIRTTDPNGHSWTNVFNNLNRLVEQHNPDGTAAYFYYDPLGNLTSKLTPNGDSIAYGYDALNRLTNAAYPTGPPVVLAYDEVGNRINMVDATGTTTWHYDLLNRLVSVTDPFGQTVSDGFDANGNRIRLIYPGNKTVNYGFDALNRMTSLTNWLGGVVSYGYDTRGDLTVTTNANSTTVLYSYDAANRLVALTNNASGNHHYELITTPDPISWLDANNAAVARGGHLATISSSEENTLVGNLGSPGLRWIGGYQPASSIEPAGGWSWVTGEPFGYTHWYLSEPNNGGDGHEDYIAQWNYDSDFFWIDAPNSPDGGWATRAFAVEYDANIIAAYSLTLDGVGNHTQAANDQPLSSILSNQTNNYTYSSDNRLLAIDGQTVTHNANGDLTAIGTNANYTYDFQDRLLSLANGLTNVSFTYDGLGNRLTRILSGQARHFVLDRLGALTQVLAETDTNNSPVAYYVYGLGLAERISADGTVATYHFDIQGSTVALSDSGGNVTDSYAYDSFGVLANADGDFPQPFRYLGRYGILDDGTGLLYARARYWSPQLGRFFTKDPVTGKDSDSQSLNRYVYALNSPPRFIDLAGLSSHEGNFSAYNPSAADAAYWDAFFESFDHSWGYKVLIVGKYAGEVAQIPLAFLSGGESIIAKQAIEKSIWELAPILRGDIIENLLGRNLAKNFPVIDKFANGVATSIKSLDLNAATYQNTANLASKINSYVDSLASFNGQTWAGRAIEGSEIVGKELQLAIPSGSISVAQKAVIEAATTRAANMGIELITTVIP